MSTWKKIIHSGNAADIKTLHISEFFTITGKINFKDLPTSDPGELGALWVDTQGVSNAYQGVIRISTGP